MKKILTLCIVALCCQNPSAQAQITRQELRENIELASSNYCDYPLPTVTLTAAPEGYEPFYVSHYGRHGARYMTEHKSYERLIAKLDTAQMQGFLSTKGQDVLRRLRIAGADAQDRDGDLTPLGGRQHQGIAERMFHNFPELFSKPLSIRAKSSTVRRCMISMANFCMQLKSLNPSLDIDMQANQKDMWYVVSNDSISISHPETEKAVYEKLAAFRSKKMTGKHQMEILFTDAEKAARLIDGSQLEDMLYNISQDMYCVPELGVRFGDVFTADELIDCFEVNNASWATWEGLIPGTASVYHAHLGLLRDILNRADKAIQTETCGADLRFGHDSVVLPLAYMLQLREATGCTDDYDHLLEHFSLNRAIPMAGNIQLIFYRKSGSQDVLVKFLMNERETTIPVQTDCAPYYHWTDVRAFYQKFLDQNVVTYKTPK